MVLNDIMNLWSQTEVSKQMFFNIVTEKVDEFLKFLKGCVMGIRDYVKKKDIVKITSLTHKIGPKSI